MALAMIGQAKSSQEGPSLSSAVSTQAFVNKGPQGTLLPPYTLPVSTNSLLTSRQAVNNQAGPSILGGYAPASEQYAVPSHHQGSGLDPYHLTHSTSFPHTSWQPNNSHLGPQATHNDAFRYLEYAPTIPEDTQPGPSPHLLHKFSSYKQAGYRLSAISQQSRTRGTERLVAMEGLKGCI